MVIVCFLYLHVCMQSSVHCETPFDSAWLHNTHTMIGFLIRSYWIVISCKHRRDAMVMYD